MAADARSQNSAGQERFATSSHCEAIKETRSSELPGERNTNHATYTGFSPIRLNYSQHVSFDCNEIIGIARLVDESHAISFSLLDTDNR